MKTRFKKLVSIGLIAVMAMSLAACSDGSGSSSSSSEEKTTEDGSGKIGVAMPTKDLQRCCLLYTSPSPRDMRSSRMPSSA